MRYLASTALSLLISLGCSAAMAEEPISTPAHVDLPRFMGDWYVIASIPTFLEKNAFNAIESYRRDPDGSIATTFTFHKGAFDGQVKTMKPRGWVRDTGTNARWGMQFIWPIKAEYVIAYVNDAYTQTIIARTARDYVWIMARTPQLDPVDYQRLLDAVGALGYDKSKVKRVPQRWP